MFFEVLVSLLGEHGVTIHDANVKETGKVKIEIDFSEHDKVFEDKIESLEKQIERLMREKQLAYDRSEQLMKTTDIINSANIELKQEKLDKNEKIAELACENESLKQRIAELEDKIGDRDEINRCLREQIAESESKESVNPMRIEFYADNGEPFTPLEVANSLINQNTFKVDELKELAEHLLVYCKHNKERNNEKEI